MNPQDILDLTGPAVLLDVRSRTKKPTRDGWQKITLADMSPLYLSELRGNIGVSLGAESAGLHTIDCDDEAGFALMGSLNPAFADTLQSHGSRGGNYWLRIDGEAPPLKKLRDIDGNAVGEWRGGGGQTVIHGTHPSGIRYRHNGQKAITIPFDQLVWPDNWVLPWKQTEDEQEAEPRSKAARTAPADKQGGTPQEVVEAMLFSIPPRPDRDLWMKISAAVRNSLGNTSAAIDLLKRWSPEEASGEYAELLSSPFVEITFGTLVHHAGENGFAGVVRRFFYNGRSFAMQGRAGFIPLPAEGAVKQHIAELRIPGSVHNSLLCKIREEQFVDYIGPIAGHPAGLHIFNGRKTLVTSSPKIVRAAEGACPFLTRFFHDLFAADPEQERFFLDWLAHARRALLSGRRAQTPAMAMAGPRGGGKSLAIEIISRTLGGRAARAYSFLSGESSFNLALIGAELLVIDDDAASKDHRARVRFAQAIKAHLFGGFVTAHGKNKDGFDVDTIQALVVAVNDDAENLRVLPELDESLSDKILLLKTGSATLPDHLAGRMEAISNLVDAELPGFLHALESRDLSSAYDSRGRFICHWNRSILEDLGELAPEHQLLELIHQAPAIRREHEELRAWTGTAAQLEGLLTDRDAYTQSSARRLLSWGGACGVYLGKLAEENGTGVSKLSKDSRTRIRTYSIRPTCPNMEQEQAECPY